ncbi:hypothetical protein HPP92_016550, partial [Vanilla planifolia]
MPESRGKQSGIKRAWGFCFIPFRNSVRSSSSSMRLSSSMVMVNAQDKQPQVGGLSVASLVKALFPAKRRLRLDPPKKLYFP